MSEFAQLWWSQVHGPRTFLENFCRQAVQGGCLFLQHSRPIPWPFHFQEEVCRRVRNELSHVLVEEPADVPEDDSVQWFVERFLPQRAADFLSSTPLPGFLAETHGLDRRLVWLRVHTESQYKRWLDLLTEFGAKVKSPSFIVILEGYGPTSRRHKDRLFDADASYTPFDVVQLCTVAANAAQCRELYKPYLTHLLGQLCGTEPGQVELLQEQGEALVKDPSAAAPLLGMDPMEADRRIRRAQLLLLLPVLEDIRIHSLTQLYDQCQALLPLRDDYENLLEDVYEMELRHIKHHRNAGSITMTDALWDEVFTAYQVRNALMHTMTALPFDDIKHLLRLADGISNN